MIRKREINFGKIFVKKTYVYNEPFEIKKALLDTYDPPTVESSNYKNWIAILDLKTCIECRSHHGQIYHIDDIVDPEPPLHENCRCAVKNMDAVFAGGATKNGEDGADYYLKYLGILPDYYISDEELRELGWRDGKRPAKFAPDKMYTRGIYNNEDHHLPDADGRIWYEADINYYEGRRNRHRILWSNDGLIFVTYDHYHTFYEIV